MTVWYNGIWWLNEIKRMFEFHVKHYGICATGCAWIHPAALSRNRLRIRLADCWRGQVGANNPPNKKERRPFPLTLFYLRHPTSLRAYPSSEPRHVAFTFISRTVGLRRAAMGLYQQGLHGQLATFFRFCSLPSS